MGISYKAALDLPLLGPEAEQEAIRLWRETGDRASLDLLLRSHARMVYAQALRWTRDPVALEDLVAEGMIGLMRAVEKFDPEAGTRFSTYARWWVVSAVATCLVRLKTVIDLPARTFMDLRAGRLTGREQDLAASAAQILALDADPVGEDGLRLHERLSSPDPTPEETVLRGSDRSRIAEMIEQAVSRLPEPDREILRRHRLDQDESLADIAADLGLSRERVRQYEARGMARLKRSLIEQGFSPLMLNE